MTDVCWSRFEGVECVRLRDLSSAARVQVRPAAISADLMPTTGELPSMAGRLVRDANDVCFVPRFAFLDGTAYRVDIDGVTAAVLVRRVTEGSATTEVLAIYPTAAKVPRNLLRLYVWFSARMSEGFAGRDISVADSGGAPIRGALLPMEYELWDPDRRRLTVLLDPARIKRGLAAHRQAGYPLGAGQAIRLVVDHGFPDAQGRPLRAGAERHYDVGGDERGRVDPAGWPWRGRPVGAGNPWRYVSTGPSITGCSPAA